MTEATHSDSLVIGVDVGGTKMAAGLVDPEGEIPNKFARPWLRTEMITQSAQSTMSAHPIVSKWFTFS
jgi:predicted NBD/HSP70 family sugar kinase